MQLYHLRLGWWNVNLSSSAPQATPNGNSTIYQEIASHISRLFKDESYHFLALGEVSKVDLIGINNALSDRNLDYLDLTGKVGNAKFDLGVFYNTQHVNVSHINGISRKVQGANILGAQLVKMTSVRDSSEIYVYICHWRARIMDAREQRMKAADSVRRSAEQQLELGKDVIIMGDFNDNPYDPSLTRGLQATRCHDAAIKFPDELFYNPFWRSVVSEKKHHRTTSKTSYKSGTFRYKGDYDGVTVMWNCYDQIVLSGSFLNGERWHLNELKTDIERDSKIMNDYDDGKHLIDHLPIICEITRA